LTEKRKRQIGDLLVALGVALFIVVVPSALAIVVVEEEWQTINCMTTDTLMTCVSRQPCDTYARTPEGVYTVRKATVNWPEGTPPGDFNQAEFERAVESRCGKIK
jgi:hypothetical protein